VGSSSLAGFAGRRSAERFSNAGFGITMKPVADERHGHDFNQQNDHRT
jgi:hypothetical protein